MSKYKFYKSNINKRIVFGNEVKAIELVGPDGGTPNFEYIKWNLTNYSEIKDVSLNFPLLKGDFNKDKQFVNVIKKVNSEDHQSIEEVFIFLHSPINNKGKGDLYSIVPYILKEYKKGGWRKNNGNYDGWTLAYCSYSDFKNFAEYPPAFYFIGDEDRIILKTKYE